mmetsp:Transcript_67366/g.187935  ORF Transcript_67366/g.187935 Transcript_67366/m.187935 type:complete len:228 (+) Transcript_67366:142-825(+)
MEGVPQNALRCAGPVPQAPGPGPRPPAVDAAGARAPAPRAAGPRAAGAAGRPWLPGAVPHSGDDRFPRPGRGRVELPEGHHVAPEGGDPERVPGPPAHVREGPGADARRLPGAAAASARARGPLGGLEGFRLPGVQAREPRDAQCEDRARRLPAGEACVAEGAEDPDAAAREKYVGDPEGPEVEPPQGAPARRGGQGGHGRRHPPEHAAEVVRHLPRPTARGGRPQE